MTPEEHQMLADTKALSEDLTALRGNLKAGGFAWKHIFGFLGTHSRWFASKSKKKAD